MEEHGKQKKNSTHSGCEKQFVVEVESDQIEGLKKQYEKENQQAGTEKKFSITSHITVRGISLFRQYTMHNQSIKVQFIRLNIKICLTFFAFLSDYLFLKFFRREKLSFEFPAWILFHKIFPA